MPNTPCSTAQNPSKKRKLSLASTSIDDSSATKSISNGSGDQVNSEQADVDDSILNSEVYKIYCRERDPEVAMTKIKGLKNCILFRKSNKPFPDAEAFKRACETTLDRLWKFSPDSSDSKFDKIKKFVNNDIFLCQLTNDDEPLMDDTLDRCFTKIRMLLPNGWFQALYIADFNEGPGKSKWYCATAACWRKSRLLARLNVMGLNNSAIAKLHYGHFIRKNSTKKEWIDFAKDSMGWYSGRFESPMKESVTKSKVGVTAILQTNYFTDFKRKVTNYQGESTRQVTKKQKPEEVLQKHRAEMTKEAEKAALEEYFRERFGFNEFKDMVCDELSRPIKV